MEKRGQKRWTAGMIVFSTIVMQVILIPRIGAWALRSSHQQHLPIVHNASQADIWRPAPGTTWQWQLTGTIDTSFDVQMYDVDLFDTPQTTIEQLHAYARSLIFYLRAGSLEG